MKEHKDMITRFDEKFSDSNFWLNAKNYPKNYNDVKKFIKYVIEETKEKTEIFCEEQYQVFIKEIRKEHKDFLLEEIKKVEERAYEKGYAKKNNELFLEERKRWEEEQKWIDIPNEVVEAVKKEERKIFLDKIEGMKIPIGSGGYLTEEGCMHNKLIDKILINLT